MKHVQFLEPPSQLSFWEKNLKENIFRLMLITHIRKYFIVLLLAIFWNNFSHSFSFWKPSLGWTIATRGQKSFKLWIYQAEISTKNCVFTSKKQFTLFYCMVYKLSKPQLSKPLLSREAWTFLFHMIEGLLKERENRSIFKSKTHWKLDELKSRENWNKKRNFKPSVCHKEKGTKGGFYENVSI